MSNIEWYPGHIAKAKKQIREYLKLVDIVIEIIDARCPLSSINFLNEEIKKFKKLLIINKIDLIDKNDLTYVLKKIKTNKNIFNILYLDSRKNNIDKIIDKSINSIYNIYAEKNKQKGINDTKIKAMVVGAPNVGKSTFINSYIKKHIVETKNLAGTTKNITWIKQGKYLLLLDTPGVTIPKFSSEDAGINLALVGCINDNILQKTEIMYLFIDKIKNDYFENLISAYKIDILENDETIDIINKIADKFKFYKKNNDIDYEKVSNVIINDFRKGKLGKIFLEKNYEKIK